MKHDLNTDAELIPLSIHFSHEGSQRCWKNSERENVHLGIKLHLNKSSCIDLLVNILWFQNSISCFEATHGFQHIHIYLSSTTLGPIDLQYSDMQVIYVWFTITTFITC